MSCSALNVDLRHKDPPKLLSLRDGGFLSACVRNGTWELEVGGAGGAGARPIFFSPPFPPRSVSSFAGKGFYGQAASVERSFW